MSRLLAGLKYAIAFPIFVASWYFFFVSIHLILNGEAGLTRILVGTTLGLIGVLISGYIMAPVLAEQIADSVMEHLRPVMGMIPGGRRRTDPPAEPPDEPPPPPQDV